MLALPDLPLSPNITRAQVALVYAALHFEAMLSPSRMLPSLELPLLNARNWPLSAFQLPLRMA